jgi:sugar phosphate isomerase/epimerase
MHGIPLNSFGKERVHEEFLAKIGVCTGLSNYNTIASAGFNYLEEGVRSFLVPSENEDVFNEKLALVKTSGVPVAACNSFLPAELKCVGPEPHHEKIILFTETAFRRAQMAGIQTIVLGSSGSRSIPEGFSKEEASLQFIELCWKIALIGEKYNVVIALEPLNRNECNFINSVTEGVSIVKAVNHPNFMVLADIYHMLIENEGPESLIENGLYLRHIHIAEKEGRSAPGVHGEDFTAYFKALKTAGYKGKMSIECRWDNMELQAQKALDVLRTQIAAS